MYHKILVAYDGTPESRLALQECIRLAPPPSAEIHLLAVMTPSPVFVPGDFVAAVSTVEEELAEQQAMEQVLESGCAMLAKAGLKATIYLEVGEPVHVIADMVDRMGIGLVIVGHSRHKPFALRWWRGSVDAMLIEKVRCSVLVAADPKHAP